MIFPGINTSNDLSGIKAFLDKKVELYNNLEFIETDPIQVPHRFTLKEDIEIAAFLTSTIAWGQRISIIKNAKSLMALMENSPYDFIINAGEKDFSSFKYFVHRTFQGTDCIFFLKSLQNIYINYGGLEKVFTDGFKIEKTVFGSLNYFREIFFSLSHETRSRKHVANVLANASAKRLNMFLRWMVRKDDKGVDFGIWSGIPQSSLMLPLDLHTSNTARQLGLLKRKQNDWKAVEEITAVLRNIDPIDPVKYDFALFGIGAFENQ
jgi:uncharacterized protein (TIGR02757 family)